MSKRFGCKKVPLKTGDIPKMVYKVPVIWSAMGYVRVEAEDADSAKAYVKEHLDEFPLPRDSEYLDDSFEVDDEGEPIMVSAYWGG